VCQRRGGGPVLYYNTTGGGPKEKRKNEQELPEWGPDITPIRVYRTRPRVGGGGGGGGNYEYFGTWVCWDAPSPSSNLKRDLSQKKKTDRYRSRSSAYGEATVIPRIKNNVIEGKMKKTQEGSCEGTEGPLPGGKRSDTLKKGFSRGNDQTLNSTPRKK